MDTQLMLSNVIKEKLNLTDDGENERMAERLTPEYANVAIRAFWRNYQGRGWLLRSFCDFSADNVRTSMLGNGPA